MSSFEPLPRRSSRSRPRLWPRMLALVLGALAVLAVGVALGRALADRPAPGGEQTIVRTLEPLPQRAP